MDSIDIYSIDGINGMVEKPSVSPFQNFLRIENQLNIKVTGHFIQSSVEFFTPHGTLYKVLCKSHKHQCINSLDKHSIQCIVCFDLHIYSVNKKDTIHNTQ